MRRKEKRYINLGEDFLLKNDLYIRGNYDGLYDCYNRPSGRKAYIFDYYRRLLENNADRVIRYGIGSYNCNIITLEADIIKDGIKYYVYITPSYNYIMELGSEATSCN